MAKVGDVFVLDRPMLGNPAGVFGVVFNDYGSGVQLIFPNGEYDGFDEEEQKAYLIPAGHAMEVAGYQFRNVIQVGQDFRRGYWKVVIGG